MDAPIVVLTYFSVPKYVNIHGLRDVIPENSSHEEIDGPMKEVREWLGAMCDLVYSEGHVESLWGRLSRADLEDGHEKVDDERVLLVTSWESRIMKTKFGSSPQYKRYHSKVSQFSTNSTPTVLELPENYGRWFNRLRHGTGIHTIYFPTPVSAETKSTISKMPGLVRRGTTLGHGPPEEDQTPWWRLPDKYWVEGTIMRSSSKNGVMVATEMEILIWIHFWSNRVAEMRFKKEGRDFRWDDDGFEGGRVLIRETWEEDLKRSGAKEILEDHCDFESVKVQYYGRSRTVIET